MNHTKFRDMKIWEQALLVSVVAIGLLFLMSVAFGGNTPSCTRANAAECGYDDYGN